jgi:hypothetical protein
LSNFKSNDKKKNNENLQGYAASKLARLALVLGRLEKRSVRKKPKKKKRKAPE